MRATVIGAAGFVGSALVRSLRLAGWTVLELRRTDADDRPGRTAQGQSADNHHVFYCAGLTADYGVNPVITVEAHAGRIGRVLEAGGFESLTYLSSTRLYDGQGPVLATGSTDRFTVDPTNPRHLFDLSKLLGEWQVLNHKGARTHVARLSCVYRDHHDPDGFLGDVMRRVLQTQPGSFVTLESSPHFVRDYVHLDDVVAALMLIAIRGHSRIYNLASGQNVSNQKIAQVLQSCSGRCISFNSVAPAPSAPVVAADASIEELGWRPRALQHALQTWCAQISMPMNTGAAST